MALSYECMQSCAQIVLEIADIVGGGDFPTITISNCLDLGSWRSP
jgi:hypothetical protein